MGFEVYMQDILRNVSSALLVPVMVVLAAFCVYALYCIGSIITEAIMQRSHYKENIPRFINEVEAAPPADVANVIRQSGMLEPHKRALLEVAANMQMTPTDLYALSAREEELLEEHYGAVTARTDQVAKLAPMFGLMGTLIPLGPGIVALGIGDTETLSSSLLVAFDTTVAGLASGAVCSVVGRIRKSWYKKYTDAVHAAMVAILQKAEDLRTADSDADECVREAEAIIEHAESAIAAPVPSVGIAQAVHSSEPLAQADSAAAGASAQPAPEASAAAAMSVKAASEAAADVDVSAQPTQAMAQAEGPHAAKAAPTINQTHGSLSTKSAHQEPVAKKTSPVEPVGAALSARAAMAKTTMAKPRPESRTAATATQPVRNEAQREPMNANASSRSPRPETETKKASSTDFEPSVKRSPAPEVSAQRRHAAWNAEWEERLYSASPDELTQEWPPVSSDTVVTPAETQRKTSRPSEVATTTPRRGGTAKAALGDKPNDAVRKSDATPTAQAQSASAACMQPEPQPAPQPEPQPEPDALVFTFDTGLVMPERRA